MKVIQASVIIAADMVHYHKNDIVEYAREGVKREVFSKLQDELESGKKYLLKLSLKEEKEEGVAAVDLRVTATLQYCETPATI